MASYDIIMICVVGTIARLERSLQKQREQLIGEHALRMTIFFGIFITRTMLSSLYYHNNRYINQDPYNHHSIIIIKIIIFICITTIIIIIVSIIISLRCYGRTRAKGIRRKIEFTQRIRWQSLWYFLLKLSFICVVSVVFIPPSSSLSSYR